MATFVEVLTYILYVLLAVLSLVVMIVVHELGHYITGKIFKFGIEEFSIGFGPKLFQRKNKSGELISLRAIPLGGYCAFEGEDEKSVSPSAFSNKHPFFRILVLISGAVMNFLLAIFIIILMTAIWGQSCFVVGNIDASLPQNEYRLQSNDVILSVDGKDVYLYTDIISAIDEKTQAETDEKPINVTVKRNGETKTVAVKLFADANFKNIEDISTLYKVFGLSENDGLMQTRIRLGFFETIGNSFKYAGKIGGTIFSILHQLLNGRLGISSMGGTVSVITMTANAVKTSGIYYLFQIMAFVGVNLALFNLLPFPALDGCQVLFVLFEWIFKKPINKKVQSVINFVGLIALILFAVFVDVQHLFT